MKVKFLSFDDDNNKIYFVSEATTKENILSFTDKSCENTIIDLTIENDSLTLIRRGNTNMRMSFLEGQVTKGSYHNSMGLEFEFAINCLNLQISANRIRVDYDMIIDEYTKTRHKLSLLFT